MSIFGGVPIASHILASALDVSVASDARELQARGMKETSAWTLALKRRLLKLGEERGYEVLCSGIENTCEWLLDVVWWAKDPKVGLGIMLACESEWLENPKDVIIDFQKLLCTKAPLKLLVYTGGGSIEIKTGQKIRESVRAEMLAYLHHVAGEEYLFMGMDVGGSYAHGFKVPRNGRIWSVEFVPIALARGQSA